MKIEITFTNVNCAIKVTTPDGNTIDIVPSVPAAAEETEEKPEPAATATTAEKECAAPSTGAAAPDTNTVEANAISSEITAMNREYERVRKAAYRAKKKLEATLQALGQTVTAAAANCPAPVPANIPCPVPVVEEACPGVVPNVPKPLPGDNRGQGTENSTYSNIITYNYNKTLYNKSTSNQTFIPLAQLPEVYRNVVTEWNKLPLKEKLKGLFTDKAKELYVLLQQFGEATVQEAIRTVAECPFLLGKSANSRGWVISFGWLMKSHNMEKVLADRYRDKKNNYQGYDNYNLAYTPWLEEGTDYYNCNAVAAAYNGNTTNAAPEALTAHTAATWDDVNENAATCLLDPAEMFKGVTNLSDQARRGLMNAASKLGLTKGQVA